MVQYISTRVCRISISHCTNSWGLAPSFSCKWCWLYGQQNHIWGVCRGGWYKTTNNVPKYYEFSFLLITKVKYEMSNVSSPYWFFQRLSDFFLKNSDNLFSSCSVQFQILKTDACWFVVDTVSSHYCFYCELRCISLYLRVIGN